jgi:hypothetical protein
MHADQEGRAALRASARYIVLQSISGALRIAWRPTPAAAIIRIKAERRTIGSHHAYEVGAGGYRYEVFAFSSIVVA